MRVDPGVAERNCDGRRQTNRRTSKGARPDLSVDGTIDLERLDNVLYVGRPAFGQEKQHHQPFQAGREREGCGSRTGEVGRESVNSIQISRGFHEGDTVILFRICRAGKGRIAFSLSRKTHIKNSAHMNSRRKVYD